jgi:HEPN domain-containing protein
MDSFNFITAEKAKLEKAGSLLSRRHISTFKAHQYLLSGCSESLRSLSKQRQSTQDPTEILLRVTSTSLLQLIQPDWPRNANAHEAISVRRWY